MNTWTGVGRLTKDCELKKTTSGTSVCTFALAINKDEKTKEGEKDAWFFDVVAWHKKAEYIGTYGKKGDVVAVTGPLRFKDYEGKNGHVYSVECIAERVNIIAKNNREPRRETANPNEAAYKEAGFSKSEMPTVADSDDLPF